MPLKRRQEHREPDEYLIPLADLAVTVDDRRFYLIRMSTGRRVEPRVAVVDHDRRQPMDLGHRLHRLLLRTRLQRAGRI
ncbi:MAG: lantibiotic dehydratase, partial [Pseudonocardiaceae bacterium]